MRPLGLRINIYNNEELKKCMRRERRQQAATVMEAEKSSSGFRSKVCKLLQIYSIELKVCFGF